jgi:hypothetical protein
MEVLLVKAGVKPVTEIQLYSDTWEKEGENRNRKYVNREQIKEIIKILKDLNLVNKIEEPIIEEDVGSGIWGIAPPPARVRPVPVEPALSERRCGAASRRVPVPVPEFPDSR